MSKISSVLDTARSLVQIPSVNPGYDPESPGEKNAVQWIADWAREQGFETEIQTVLEGRENIILRLRNGEGPRLLLNGHTDTVGVQGMTIPPFGGEVREGRLWGRGSADMKGPLACMLHTLLALRENPTRWKGSVTLACVMDEELVFRGIKHFLKTDANYDCAIVGEPTRFSVVRGCKGCLRFTFTALGKAAHSSTPELGKSAINAMARGILALEKFFEEELGRHTHPDLGRSTGSVGILQGGKGVNIVPDLCEAKVDVRLVVGQDWEATYAAIQECVRREAGDAGIEWKFEEQPLSDPSFCLEQDHPLVRKVCEATGNATAQVVKYSCDASKIIGAGIPCVIYAPGDIAHAHTVDESIGVDELERGVAEYVRITEALLPA